MNPQRFRQDTDVSNAGNYHLGDRVASVSGGREMTISRVSTDFLTETESIECRWFESGIPQTATFSPDELRRVGETNGAHRPIVTGFGPSSEA